ncbi:MAG: hypothetical protein R2752_17690 [Vicinamibacterales bacterium]
MLAAAGAACGLLVAPVLLSLLLERLPPGLTLVKDVQIDWRVLAFTGLVSASSAFVVAVLAVRVAIRRAGTTPGLLDPQGRATARPRLGRALIAGQTAIAFALVLGGALFASSLAASGTRTPASSLPASRRCGSSTWISAAAPSRGFSRWRPLAPHAKPQACRGPPCSTRP